ncbi:GGDEF domain-containing protein [Pseudoalteromonas gelatinilytica]|uniref:diguanylate cyclase n=1 Tax=Pseudoalteromonas gelatinilytica TaxID=1703256 RepID=A0A3A3EM45_9GAMM|nr:GGDEF domain-containing protein [Pseudoalteromonas profundi]RJF34511.1 GGDEF domain-containing protein [Pseudoalteromonas profundi]
MGAFAAKLLNEDMSIERYACQFKSLQVEQAFLQSKFAQDKKIAQFLTCLIAVVTFLVTFFDKMIIQASFWPDIALIGRAVTISVCLLSAFGLGFIKTPRQLKPVIVVFMVFLFLNIQFMVVTYERNYILHMFFDVIILITFYFSTLLSLKLSLFLGVAYSVFAVIVIYSYKDISTHSFYVVILAHVAANLAGLIMAAQEHTMRRALFVRNTQLAQLAHEMKTQALKDALTQLPNRRAFDNAYEEYQRLAKQQQGEAKQVCVILADIDYFKRVNDTHGHEVGDVVLQRFSAFLTQSLRTSDDVYRFGGEEFVIVLPLCSVPDATVIINSMISRLNREVCEVGELSLPIRASFGLTVMQEEPKKSVISRADAALYQAKDAGRNQLVIKL